MNLEFNKAILLLQSTIFHYHGLDDNERLVLKKLASELHAENELVWVNEFISQDYFTAYERSKKLLIELLKDSSKDDKLKLIKKIWKATNQKGNGNITEMEARALLSLAKEFSIESELLHLIRSGEMA